MSTLEYGPTIHTIDCSSAGIRQWRDPPSRSVEPSNLARTLPQREGVIFWASSESTVDSEKLEHGWRMIYAGFPFFVLGSQDGHIPTFWLLLQGDAHPAPDRDSGFSAIGLATTGTESCMFQWQRLAAPSPRRDKQASVAIWGSCAYICIR